MLKQSTAKRFDCFLQLHQQYNLNQLFMEDSPTFNSRKFSNEKPSGNPRRISDFHSSPFSQDDSGFANIYPGVQPQLQEKKIFGFEIFVDNQILDELEDINKWFDNMVDDNGVEYIKFNEDLTIPDLRGRNIQIYDADMEKKYQCAKDMLNKVYQIFKKIKKEAFSIIIFVPEGMVSLLIGTKGHQINKIMKQSHTTIVVNQPINRMTYRTAKIQGYHSDIAKACRIIYQILEEKSSIAYSIQKQPSQLDYTKSKVKSKFIFTDNVITFFQKKKKSFMRKIEEETHCLLRFETDRENKLLKKDEGVCVLVGKLEDVQAMLVVIINIINDFLCDDKRRQDYTLKMLIPANFVTKLIGQKGYMIRDIIQRSGGSQIKILSDKQSERDIKQCIISINGSKQNKIDASCLILQQIQCFKNGGPILQSGKSINENLAQQFKNSIALREEDRPDIDQTIEISAVPTSLSPTIKPSSSFNINVNEDEGNKSEEEGLIGEDQLNDYKQKQNTKEKKKEQEIIFTHKREKRRRTPSKQDSRSRSRQVKKKDKERVRKPDYSKRPRSQSESNEYKFERQFVEVRLLVPRKFAQDNKQIKYVQSLGKSEVLISEQKHENQSIITVRGSMKDNSNCLRLLQKRLARFKTTGSISSTR